MEVRGKTCNPLHCGALRRSDRRLTYTQVSCPRSYNQQCGEKESPNHCVPPKFLALFPVRLKRGSRSLRSIVREYYRHHVAKCNRLTVECSRLILPSAQRFKCPIDQSGIESAI